jgi:hypothetical protein
MLAAFTLDVLYPALRKYCHSQIMDATNNISSWLLYKIVDIIKHRSVQHSSIVATGIVTSTLVFISILSAFPWVRK